MSTVAEIMAKTFRQHGVTDVFGQSLPSAFFLAAEKEGIRQVAYRTENAGGAMADGFARSSQRIGLVGAQNGPAATLLVPPLAEAMKVSSPVVAIVQEVPMSQRDKNAFQEYDHGELFSSCAKWIKCVDDPARAHEYVNRAVTVATSGRPGPVVLLMPKDVLDANVEEPEAGTGSTKLGEYPLDRTRPDGERVAEAANLFAHAKAPLVVAGGGVHLSGAAEEVARLQERASIPVATTNMGKGCIDETHELSLGVIGNALGKNSPNRQVRNLVESADVIFFVGSRANENGTDSWSLFPAGATYVHLDVDGGEVGRNYPAHRLVGDARLGLQDIIAELENVDLSARNTARNEIARQVAAAKETAAAESAERIAAPAEEKLTPQQAMAVLDRHLGESDIAVADASYSTLWMTGYLTAKKAGQRFISPRGLAGLGWGLPLAMGAQTAHPDKRVVCISGDGGYGHVWAEMEAAIRNRQPIVSILLNNSILGFQKHAEIAQFSQYTSAISIASVDHAAIARAIGADADRVTNVEEFDNALKQAMSSSNFHLIEVMTDADSYPPITTWDDTDPEEFVG